MGDEEGPSVEDRLAGDEFRRQPRMSATTDAGTSPAIGMGEEVVHQITGTRGGAERLEKPGNAARTPVIGIPPDDAAGARPADARHRLAGLTLLPGLPHEPVHRPPHPPGPTRKAT